MSANVREIVQNDEILERLVALADKNPNEDSAISMEHFHDAW